MAQQSPHEGGPKTATNWRTVLLVAARVVLVVVFALVFLVLTGIIAEPETVIESIVRGILGQ